MLCVLCVVCVCVVCVLEGLRLARVKCESQPTIAGACLPLRGTVIPWARRHVYGYPDTNVRAQERASPQQRAYRHFLEYFGNTTGRPSGICLRCTGPGAN